MMAARANIVVADRTTPTPVNHTFTPDGEDTNGVHIFSEKTAVRAGDPRFTISLRQSKGKVRPSLRLAVPIVATQTINGVSSPVVIRTAYIDMQATFDVLSTTQERADAVGMFANALASSQTMIDDLLVDLINIW